VVSTTISAIPELIENETSGLLVPPANPEALAAAITILLDSTDSRSRCISGGRRKVAEEVSEEVNAEKLSQILVYRPGRWRYTMCRINTNRLYCRSPTQLSCRNPLAAKYDFSSNLFSTPWLTMFNSPLENGAARISGKLRRGILAEES